MNFKSPLGAATAAVLIATTINANAGGGQRVLSREQTCQITVPADWKVSQTLKGIADAPDDSMSVVISNGAEDTTLALAKQVMTSSYSPAKTFEDSPQRLFYEYEQPGNKFPLGVYVGVPGRHNDVCGAQINFRKASQLDAAKRMALSVGPAP